MSTTSTAPPIPTALVVPIIEAFVGGIHEAFAFLLVSTVFGSILIPLLILLFVLSTPQTRRKPIFILNVFSVGLGIIAAGMNAHLAIKPILAPFNPINLTEGLVFTVLDVWLPWIAEAILLVRIAVVFPRPKLPLLLAFPLTIKIGRIVLSIIFTIRWVKLTLAGNSSQFAVLDDLGRPLFKASFLLELFDNAYVSLLFLWKLRVHSRPRLFDGSGIERINAGESYTSKIQRLFWIASTNFIFPLIFGIIRIIATFIGKSAVLYSVFYTVNAYVAIISTVFATIWSSTASLKEALQDQSDTIASSQPVIFHVEQRMATTTSEPPTHVTEPVEDPKTENWELK